MTVSPGISEHSNELLSTTVKRLLLDRIMSGQYEPGGRIVELQLAKELGMSQSPIREALRDLAAAGVITIHPRRGARVRMPSAKELADVSIVRAEIDALAARLTAGAVSEATLAKLQDLIDTMLAGVGAADFLGITEADVEFHRLIAQTAGNHALVSAFDHLSPFGRTFITLKLPNVDVRHLLMEHVDILEALRDGDAERASKAAREHQLNVSKLIEDHYQPTKVG
ncbi:MAG: Transcriptional regulator, GntR family [Pseudarthrobacter sp.]|nr:Transcriptional regulator, GntR family [Pseudarthrobacter sp.]